MNGKEKCELLKLIRKTFAEENGITFSSETCEQKECSGTCSKCEEDAQKILSAIKNLNSFSNEATCELFQSLIHENNEEIPSDETSEILKGQITREGHRYRELRFDPKSREFILVDREQNQEQNNDTEIEDMSGAFA